MKTLLKKSTCFLLAVLLFAGIAVTRPVTAEAADNYTDLYTSSAAESATANVPRSYDFQTKSTGSLYLDVCFQAPTSFAYTITSSSGQTVSSGTIAENDPYWYAADAGYYVNGPYFESVPVGSYTFNVTTYTDCQYVVLIYQGQPKASISNTSISVTVGFSHTLSVSNASGKITWKSSNTKIATVNSSGKVTGKKAGSCTITATTADKQSLKCKVKVVNNVYSDTKATNSDADNGKVTAYVYKASPDSKGNLVCKLRVINNTSKTVLKLNNTTVTVYNSSNKKVYSYKVTSKKITVPAYRYKDCSITIPKSKVKSCDLVKGDIRLSGTYTYRK